MPKGTTATAQGQVPLYDKSATIISVDPLQQCEMVYLNVSVGS